MQLHISMLSVGFLAYWLNGLYKHQTIQQSCRCLDRHSWSIYAAQTDISALLWLCLLSFFAYFLNLLSMISPLPSFPFPAPSSSVFHPLHSICYLILHICYLILHLFSSSTQVLACSHIAQVPCGAPITYILVAAFQNLLCMFVEIH